VQQSASLQNASAAFYRQRGALEQNVVATEKMRAVRLTAAKIELHSVASFLG
jgi:hypothetical protein